MDYKSYEVNLYKFKKNKRKRKKIVKEKEEKIKFMSI